MATLGASSAGIKKICKPLATGTSFYKLGDKVHCGMHNTPLPRFTIANYNFSPYNGTYSCDVCRKNGGLTMSSSAFHCAPCTMDICYECSNNPNTYQQWVTERLFNFKSKILTINNNNTNEHIYTCLILCSYRYRNGQRHMWRNLRKRILKLPQRWLIFCLW